VILVIGTQLVAKLVAQHAKWIRVKKVAVVRIVAEKQKV